MNGTTDERLLSPPFAAREEREAPRQVHWHHAAPLAALGTASLSASGAAVGLGCTGYDGFRLSFADQTQRLEYFRYLCD